VPAGLSKRELTWATRPKKWAARRSFPCSSSFFPFISSRSISKHRGGYDGSIFAASSRRAIILFHRSGAATIARNESALLMIARLWSCRRTGCQPTRWSIDDSPDNLVPITAGSFIPRPDIFPTCAKCYSIAIVNSRGGFERSFADISEQPFRRNANRLSRIRYRPSRNTL